MTETIYDFSAKTILGEEKSLEDYKGKVVLIVNTASKCGFTPQYKGLEELYQKYKDRGLVILGFPSDQFGNQGMKTPKEIMKICYTNYLVTFDMFGKIKVNGEKSHPLFDFLKFKKRGLFTDNIKWNFTKFLVDREGKPVKRFSPMKTPESLGKYIEELL